MATNILFDDINGIVLGDKRSPDSPHVQAAVHELLVEFFAHDGSIVALEAKPDTNTFAYSDARLLRSVKNPIMVQDDMLIVHTTDSRFSWKIGESYAVEVWREKDICGIHSFHYSEEISRILFIRGAK